MSGLMAFTFAILMYTGNVEIFGRELKCILKTGCMLISCILVTVCYHWVRVINALNFVIRALHYKTRQVLYKQTRRCPCWPNDFVNFLYNSQGKVYREELIFLLSIVGNRLMCPTCVLS